MLCVCFYINTERLNKKILVTGEREKEEKKLWETTVFQQTAFISLKKMILLVKLL